MRQTDLQPKQTEKGWEIEIRYSNGITEVVDDGEVFASEADCLKGIEDWRREESSSRAEEKAEHRAGASGFTDYANEVSRERGPEDFDDDRDDRDDRD